MTKDSKEPLGRSFAALRETVQNLPGAPLFALFLLAWVILFTFLGNSTLGYFHLPSLLGWMSNAYATAEDDAHGYLLPYVVLALLWWKRAELAVLPKRIWPPALAFLALALLIHFAGYAGQQTRISIVAFYAGIWFLVGLVWGPSVMRHTFFPFCLLSFTVPLAAISDTLTFPLRHLATTITVKITQIVLGMNVHQVGTQIFDPSGRYTYEVAAACSGIRSLTMLAVITAVYAFVMFTKPWKRLLILACSVPLAILSNVLRLMTIIIASETVSAKAGEYVHDSTLISLLPYVIGFAGVFLTGRWIKEDRDIDMRELAIPLFAALAVSLVLQELFPVHGACPAVMVFPFAAVVVLGLLGAARNIIPALRAGALTAVVTLLLIIVTGAAVQHRAEIQRLGAPGVKLQREDMFALDPATTNRTLVSTQAVALPTNLVGYTSYPLPLLQIVHKMLPKDTTFGQRRYVAQDGFMVDNMVVLMGTDRTSIHRPQICLTGQGLQIVSQELDFVRMHDPHPYDLPVMKLKFKGRRMTQEGNEVTTQGVFVYWFVSDQNLTAEHGNRMMRMAYKLIRTGVLERWAYVITMAPCPPGGEELAYDRIKDFIRTSVPQYQVTSGAPIQPASTRADAKP
jgi:exosortase